MCLGRTHLSGLKKYKVVNEGQPTIVLKAAKLPRVATCASSNTTTRPRSKSKRTRLRPKTKGVPRPGILMSRSEAKTTQAKQ